MKTKQLVAIIVACALVVGTGLTGLVSAFFLNSINEKNLKNSTEVLNNLFTPKEDTITYPETDYIGQLNIVGTIQDASDMTSLYGDNNQYNHKRTMSMVEHMMGDDKNKGIFLYIDSPGGTVYHSDELYLKLMKYKEATNRPIYAYFASNACSGAYYISMAADKIYCNRNAWTGSIGVIISMYNYKGLLDKIGVEEVDITSGENKTIGSGGLEMTEEQRGILQSMVDESYEQFVEIVANGRNLSIDKVKEVADGRIYTAKQALDNKLVDSVCGLEDSKNEVFAETGCDKLFDAPAKKSFYSLIYGTLKLKQSSSDSDIRAAMDMMNNDKNGVLMYYAK